MSAEAPSTIWALIAGTILWASAIGSAKCLSSTSKQGPFPDKWASGGSDSIVSNELFSRSASFTGYRPSAKCQSIFEQVAGLSGLGLPIQLLKWFNTSPAYPGLPFDLIDAGALCASAASFQIVNFTGINKRQSSLLTWASHWKNCRRPGIHLTGRIVLSKQPGWRNRRGGAGRWIWLPEGSQDANSAIQSAPFAWQLRSARFESVLPAIPWFKSEVKAISSAAVSANRLVGQLDLQYNSIHGIINRLVSDLTIKHVPVALHLSRHNFRNDPLLFYGTKSVAKMAIPDNLTGRYGPRVNRRDCSCSVLG